MTVLARRWGVGFEGGFGVAAFLGVARDDMEEC